MGALRQDLRFAVRVLTKNPGFSLVAVLVLTLGIGGNAAVFSLVDTLLFRPIALSEPQRLMGVYSRSEVSPDDYRPFSYPNYVDLRQRATVFSGLAAHNLSMVGLAEGDSTRRTFADVVSSNYFATLGAEIRNGRGFRPEEEEPDSEIAVAVVSDTLWRRHGSDPKLLGSTIRINGRAFAVVGIAPPGFSGTTALFSPEVWLPLGVYRSVINDFQDARRPLTDRENHCLILIGRLGPGVTREAANAELAVVASNLRNSFPQANADQTFHVAPLSRHSISTSPRGDGEVTTISVLLLAMSGIVLLVACLNLANMLLARGTARRREFAVRMAIGGGRLQLVRQLLVEGLLLSLVGGATGALFAYAGNRILLASLTRLLPIQILFPLAPDLRILLALLGFCVVGTLLFGLGPALQLVRPAIVQGLRDGGEGDRPRRRLRGLLAGRNLLVVGQLVLSMVLLTAAGLFVRGALAAAHPQLGFPVDRGVLVELDASLAGYDQATARQLYRRVVERLESLPGVESASLAATVPFGMVTHGDRIVPAESGPAAEDDRNPAARSAELNVVGFDYFHSLGLALKRGRGFSRAEEESPDAPPVAVVDEVLAERLWPGESAVGRRVRLRRRPGSEYEIVGVAPAIRTHLFAGSPEGMIYVPLGRNFQSDIHVQLRTAALSGERRQALLADIRRQLRAIDPNLPVLGLRTLAGQLDDSSELWIVRTGGTLFSIFGGLALFLSAVGAYGVRSYSVGRRTREIGVRMALGGSPRQALAMVLREGLGLAAVGLGIGLALGLAIARLLSGLLYEVSPGDPLVFVTAPLVLALVVTLACYLPARRAARIEPMVALREP